MHVLPSETEDEAKETLSFIMITEWFHFPQVNILKIYPNIDMEDLALKNGVSKLDINDSLELSYIEIPKTLPFHLFYN